MRRYEHIVSASSDHMSFVDTEYTYQAVNIAYLKAFGKTKEEIVGRHVVELLGEEVFATRIRPHLDQCLAGEHVHFQIWLELPEQGRRYLDAHYDPFRDADGSVSGVVVNVRDITERQQAEELQRRYQDGLINLDRQVRDLLSVSGDSQQFYNLVCTGIMDLVDADIGALPLIDESGETFTYVAAAGAKAELLRGRTLPVQQGGLCGWVATHGESLCVSDLASDPRVIPELAQALDVTTALLTPLRHKDRVIGGLSAFRKGRPFDDIEVQILNLFGQQVSSALDNLRLLVTLEQRVVERTTELAAANESLKELDQLKSMFIASMSHELRTPLNSIIGFTGIILQGMTGELNAKQKEQLGRVYRASKHLLELISDVIDISKIEAGKIEPFPEEFELDELIEEITGDMQPELSKKGLKLTVSVPQGIRMHTDRKRLLQCVLNYLSNALKFTESGQISIAACDLGDNLEIAVSDTGIGISEQDLPKIFQPFVRLESPLKLRGQAWGCTSPKNWLRGSLWAWKR